MLETAVFAVVFGGTVVISNVIVTLVTMRLFTSTKFLKKYTRKLKEIVSVIEEEV